MLCLALMSMYTHTHTGTNSTHAVKVAQFYLGLQPRTPPLLCNSDQTSIFVVHLKKIIIKIFTAYSANMYLSRRSYHCKAPLKRNVPAFFFMHWESSRLHLPFMCARFLSRDWLNPQPELNISEGNDASSRGKDGMHYSCLNFSGEWLRKWRRRG